VNPWPFIIAAYAIAAVATGSLVVQSWLAMRRDEAEAARQRQNP
jgi:hypothetical protein